MRGKIESIGGQFKTTEQHRGRFYGKKVIEMLLHEMVELNAVSALLVYVLSIIFLLCSLGSLIVAIMRFFKKDSSQQQQRMTKAVLRALYYCGGFAVLYIICVLIYSSYS